MTQNSRKGKGGKDVSDPSITNFSNYFLFRKDQEKGGRLQGGEERRGGISRRVAFPSADMSVIAPLAC